MSNKGLMVLHIGPVQDFIAAARRSRDLWFGSWLLSELSRTVALEIVRQHGNDLNCLVFPAPNSLAQLESTEFNVPNRVVALVTGSPPELGKAVETAVLERLRAIRTDAYQKIKALFDETTASRQVDDLLEFYWASCTSGENYDMARQQAESLLAARKVTRDFTAVTWGSQLPQSSLDGQRESVIPEDAYRRMSPEQLRRAYGIRPGERLCGVGLLKRHGARDTDTQFLSTSHVAAQPLLERLTDQEATDDYLSQLMELGASEQELTTVSAVHPVFGRADGHFLFEERLAEFWDDEGQLSQAQRALRQFLQKAFDGRKPIPYYALLAADGDHMGKLISAQTTPIAHRDFSRRLTAFAGKVASIIAQHKGSLVYSGGDDVLAFVPLHTVLECARSLANEFSCQMSECTTSEDDATIHATLSVGIAITHHLDPLSDALTLARNAEREAKSLDGKNALAITVSKRSGAELTIRGRWGTFDARLMQLIQWHHLQDISTSAAYQLREFALQLDPENQASGELRSLLQKEAMRILRRKEMQGGQENIKNEVLQELEGYLMEEDVPVGDLANELIVAHLLATAQEQADVPLEQEVTTP